MDLSVILVNWNSKDYLRKCLDSILAQTKGIIFEIVVIDSASFDGCESMIRSAFPQVRFIQSSENLGFAKANNLAAAASSGEVLLFLNPDTQLVTPAINLLLEALQRYPRAGAVGGRLLNSDGTLQTSCVQAFPTILNQVLDAEAIRSLTPHARLWGMSALFDDTVNIKQVEMISGACLMMRRAVFEEIGRFSSEYFMYCEDVDLCFKASNSGYLNLYVADALVLHHGGCSSQRARNNFASVMMAQSMSEYFAKFRGTTYSYGYRVALTASALGRVLLLILLSPFLVLAHGMKVWTLTCSKWVAILRWGFASMHSVSAWQGRHLSTA